MFKILDREKTEVRYNSEWLDKLGYYEMVRLMAKVDAVADAGARGVS